MAVLAGKCQQIFTAAVFAFHAGKAVMLIIGLAALLVIATLPADAALIELSEKDAGIVLDLQPGDQIAITLPGNPTTGYTWQLAAVRIDILEPVSDPEYIRDSTLIGAGGRFTFRFRARSRGYTKVVLAYLRTWEKDVPPLKIFDLTADVNSSKEKKPRTTVQYRSDDGGVLTASFDPNTNQVELTFPDKRAVSLPAAVSASGARYSNGYEVFWEHQGKGVYTRGSRVFFEGRMQASDGQTAPR